MKVATFACERAFAEREEKGMNSSIASTDVCVHLDCCFITGARAGRVSLFERGFYIFLFLNFVDTCSPCSSFVLMHIDTRIFELGTDKARN